MSRLFRAFAVTAAACVLASCGAETARQDPNNPTIVIWQGFGAEEAAMMKTIFVEFERDWEAEHPNRDLTIKIEYVQYGDMFTKLKSAALADITPDIAFMDAIKVTDLALGKALAPVENLETFKTRYGTVEKAREEFVEASFNAAVVNRLGEVHLYGLPVQTTTVSLFWNRAMFRDKATALTAAGLDPNRPPRDWEEFFAYGKVLSDPSKKVYAYGMNKSLWFNFPFFNMYGVEFLEYDANGKVKPVLNTERGRAAVELLKRTADSGYEGGAWRTGATGPDQGFLNGDYAMCLTGPWKVEEYSNAKLDFDIAPIPGPPPADRERLGLTSPFPDRVAALGSLAFTSSNVGGQSGVIMRSCGQQELAFELLDYFTSEDVQRNWASSLGQIPVRRSAWENLDMSKFPFMTKFMQQLEYSKRIPQIPLYGTLEDEVFNKQFDLYLQDSLTSEQFLSRVEKEMQTRIINPLNEGDK